MTSSDCIRTGASLITSHQLALKTSPWISLEMDVLIMLRKLAWNPDMGESDSYARRKRTATPLATTWAKNTSQKSCDLARLVPYYR